MGINDKKMTAARARDLEGKKINTEILCAIFHVDYKDDAKSETLINTLMVNHCTGHCVCDNNVKCIFIQHTYD